MQQKSFSLQELAKLTQSQLVGDPQHLITNVCDLENADLQDASFLANPRYEKVMHRSRAGVVFINSKTPLIPGRNFLVHENPSLAFQQLIDTFFSEAATLTGFKNVHSTAVLHPSCKLGIDVTIGPYAVIDENVIIGDHTFIGSHCYVGPYTSIGAHCTLHPRVTVRERCLIGNHVILQSGVVLGACGFGYITNRQGQHAKLNQFGNVTIEDHVEIGANTTVDRSRFKTTRIGQGTKIDNLVQIGHGVTIGSDTLIVAQTGIAGSTQIGNRVILAGQVAIAGHLKIADEAILSARTGVSKSITKSGKYGGIPALPLNEYNRMSVFLRNIETYVKEIKEMKSRLVNLESKLLEETP